MTEIKEKKPRKSRAKIKMVPVKEQLPDVKITSELRKSEDERIYADLVAEIRREKRVIYGTEN